MPKIDETRIYYNLSDVAKNHQRKEVWQACRICGKERWVRIGNNQPMHTACRACSLGELTWRGGRHISSGGYFWIRLHPSDLFYPMVPKSGYVLEHRLVIAKSLGRCLKPWEIVHHKNGVKTDNRRENLQLTTIRHHQQITQMENRIAFLEKRVTLLEAENIILRVPKTTPMRPELEER